MKDMIKNFEKILFVTLQVDNIRHMGILVMICSRKWSSEVKTKFVAVEKV